MYIIRLTTFMYNSKTFLFKIKFAIKPEIILSIHCTLNIYMIYFFSVRLVSVLRGHSWSFLRKSQYSLFNVECYWCHFL